MALTNALIALFGVLICGLLLIIVFVLTGKPGPDNDSTPANRTASKDPRNI